MYTSCDSSSASFLWYTPAEFSVTSPITAEGETYIDKQETIIPQPTHKVDIRQMADFSLCSNSCYALLIYRKSSTRVRSILRCGSDGTEPHLLSAPSRAGAHGRGCSLHELKIYCVTLGSNSPRVNENDPSQKEGYACNVITTTLYSIR